MEDSVLHYCCFLIFYLSYCYVALIILYRHYHFPQVNCGRWTLIRWWLPSVQYIKRIFRHPWIATLRSEFLRLVFSALWVLQSSHLLRYIVVWFYVLGRGAHSKWVVRVYCSFCPLLFFSSISIVVEVRVLGSLAGITTGLELCVLKGMLPLKSVPLTNPVFCGCLISWW